MPGGRAIVRILRDGAPVFQYLWPLSGFVEPLHGSARDLCVALVKPQGASDQRRREPVARFRQCSTMWRARCRLALEPEAADGETFNVASGLQITIGDLACAPIQALEVTALSRRLPASIVWAISAIVSPTSAKRADCLGLSQRWNFEKGLVDLAEWLKGQIAHDRVQESRAELARRGLMV